MIKSEEIIKIYIKLLSVSMALVFAKVTYPPSHWSLQRCTAKSPNYVADFAYKVGSNISHYNVKMNPTDSRGYRAIVSLTADDIASTFNRVYRDREIDGLMLTLSATSRSMSFLGGIVQVEVAGNNSHVFDPATGVTTLGTPSEPSMLHGHLILRGNPESCLVDGVPLRGPTPGNLFNMREGKTKWLDGEIEKVAQVLAVNIRKWYLPPGLELVATI